MPAKSLECYRASEGAGTRAETGRAFGARGPRGAANTPAQARAPGPARERDVRPRPDDREEQPRRAFLDLCPVTCSSPPPGSRAPAPSKEGCVDSRFGVSFFFSLPPGGRGSHSGWVLLVLSARTSGMVRRRASAQRERLVDSQVGGGKRGGGRRPLFLDQWSMRERSVRCCWRVIFSAKRWRSAFGL